jgi:adenylate cyclase
MKRLRIWRRWFARRFGVARLVCLGLLVGLAALRIADLPAIEELRVRTFDTFQLIDPRVKTARPVTIVEPRQIRPVAVATDPDRGHGRQSH